MGLEKKLERLEAIASKINGLKNTSLTGKTKKILYLVPVTAIAGGFDGEAQKEYVERIGFKREHAKYLTIANAAIFGLATSAIYYFGGEKSGDFFFNSELVNNVKDYLTYIGHIKDSIVSGVANVLGITTQSFFQGLSIFNVGQSFGRIFYSSITGKPAISLSISGLGGSYLNSRFNKLRKRFKTRTKPVEGVEPPTY